MQASLLSLFLVAAVAAPTTIPTSPGEAREVWRTFNAENLASCTSTSRSAS
jgi:hypothetical protein